VQVVPDSTHLVALERPAEVSRIVENFLGTIL
jgi:pimeloyl-ACP methyl ester carboxylesterase